MLEEGFQLEQRQRCQQSLLERSILTRLRELEQNHVQKRNELLELEVERLQELDEKHDQELRVYMDSLPRNQAVSVVFSAIILSAFKCSYVLLTGSTVSVAR